MAWARVWGAVGAQGGRYMLAKANCPPVTATSVPMAISISLWMRASAGLSANPASTPRRIVTALSATALVIRAVPSAMARVPATPMTKIPIWAVRIKMNSAPVQGADRNRRHKENHIAPTLRCGQTRGIGHMGMAANRTVIACIMGMGRLMVVGVTPCLCHSQRRSKPAGAPPDKPQTDQGNRGVAERRQQPISQIGHLRPAERPDPKPGAHQGDGRAPLGQAGDQRHRRQT